MSTLPCSYENFLCQFNVAQKLWGMEPSPILRNGKQKQRGPCNQTNASTWIFHDFIWMFPKIGIPPNHPILIGFSIKNHPFWGTTIFGNTHMTSLLKISTSLHKMPPPMSVLGFQVHPQICHAAGRKHGCESWAAGSSRTKNMVLPNIYWTTRWYFWNASPSSVQPINGRGTTNIFLAPENRPSQNESSIPTIHFQVLC